MPLASRNAQPDSAVAAGERTAGVGRQSRGPRNNTAAHGEDGRRPSSGGGQPVEPGPSGDGADAEDLVELFRRERVIAGRYGAEDFRVEFDLVECHTVVDTQIETVSHRAHLRR